MNAAEACVFALLPCLDGMGATPVAAVNAIDDIWVGAEQSRIVVHPNRNVRSVRVRPTLPFSYDERVIQVTQCESMAQHTSYTVYWNTPRRSSSAQRGIYFRSSTVNQ